MGAESSRVTRNSIEASGNARQKYLTPMASEIPAITTTTAIILYSFEVSLMGIGYFLLPPFEEVDDYMLNLFRMVDQRKYIIARLSGSHRLWSQPLNHHPSRHVIRIIIVNLLYLGVPVRSVKLLCRAVIFCGLKIDDAQALT